MPWCIPFNAGLCAWLLLCYYAIFPFFNFTWLFFGNHNVMKSSLIIFILLGWILFNQVNWAYSILNHNQLKVKLIKGIQIYKCHKSFFLWCYGSLILSFSFFDLDFQHYSIQTTYSISLPDRYWKVLNPAIGTNWQ